MNLKLYKKGIYIIITFILLISFVGCSMNGSFDSSIEEQAKKFDFEQASEVISAASGHEFNEAFLKSLGEDLVKQIQTEILNGTYTEKTWHDVTGSSFNVMKDMVDRKLTAENITNKGDNGGENFSVAFVGDILLDTNFAPMAHASKKGGVLNCIDADLIKYLNSCDVFLINNEFSIGERGERINGKTWTFQVAPERIQIMKDLGADIVSLANNHVYDFGEIGFLDTLEHLKKAGMPYVGAGKNLEKASEGHYFIINGYKIGIVAASRAEKKYFTPVAEPNRAGIMGTYDSTDFVEAIRKADAQCDYLVVYVHWGTENSTKLEAAQKTMAREYIDAGADAVIGGHTHCLQGMEYYKNAPIVYSVGNFWFNSKSLDSCVVTLNFDRKLNMQVHYMPLAQKGCETRILKTAEERRALFDRVESYEPQGVKISDNGIVSPS